MQRARGRPIEVFYSYSHDDEEYRKKLGKHLSVLRRAGLITDWHDRDIDAGTAWQEEIDRHLLSADIVLLLVSASFIASDYCWGDEMEKALARHEEKKARVIPIILHPSGWLRTPLQVLQGVPRDNRAISLWPNEHAAFDDVVSEIAKVVDDLRRSSRGEPEHGEHVSAVAVVASTEAAPSPPHPGPLQAGEGESADAAATPHPPADAGPSLSRRERGTTPPEGALSRRERGTTPPEGALSRRERGGVRAVPKDGVYIGVDPREVPDLAVFKDVDAPWCPEMVVLPAGEFLMGSPENERERYKYEGPQHQVKISDRFAIGRYAVTFGEYDHFCEVTSRKKPADKGSGRGWRPVINVSWRDAQAYVEWLAKQTSKPYRLPSEAEWEYACRAGTTTPFSFGATITTSQANYDGNYTYDGGPKGEYRQRTMPVGTFPPNPWGLREMHGNVWEWVEDVWWHDDYSSAPVDGTAWTDDEGLNSPSYRVVRGGSWFYGPTVLRSALRNWLEPKLRSSALGFRVARTLIRT